MQRPRLDIILPCFCPNNSWYEDLLQFHLLAKANFELKYLIVDDGSQSENLESQIKTLQDQQIPLQFISYKQNRGKGYALREGVKASEADLLIYTDIDFPFRNESTLQLMKTLSAGKADVVAGFRDQNYYLNKMSGFRKALSLSFRFFIKRILKMPISDTQCGLKGFNRKGKEKFLATTIDRYLFDFEFIYTCSRDQTIYLETVPVQLKENVVFSKMKIRVLLQESNNLLRVLLSRK